MRMVADANALFALAKKGSVACEIAGKYRLKLFAPSYAILELKKHRIELVKKSAAGSFARAKSRLSMFAEFIDPKEFREEIRLFSGIISDPKDVIYVALAKKINAPIWSNDPHLKEQSETIVLTTAELIKLLAGTET